MMAALEDEAKRTEQITETAELAWQAATSVKLFTLLTFCQYDVRFRPFYSKVDGIMVSASI